MRELVDMQWGAGRFKGESRSGGTGELRGGDVLVPSYETKNSPVRGIGTAEPQG